MSSRLVAQREEVQSSMPVLEHDAGRVHTRRAGGQRFVLGRPLPRRIGVLVV